jgi:hypothetical protein
MWLNVSNRHAVARASFQLHLRHRSPLHKRPKEATSEAECTSTSAVEFRTNRKPAATSRAFRIRRRASDSRLTAPTRGCLLCLKKSDSGRRGRLRCFGFFCTGNSTLRCSATEMRNRPVGNGSLRSADKSKTKSCTSYVSYNTYRKNRLVGG